MQEPTQDALSEILAEQENGRLQPSSNTFQHLHRKPGQESIQERLLKDMNITQSNRTFPAYDRSPAARQQASRLPVPSSERLPSHQNPIHEQSKANNNSNQKSNQAVEHLLMQHPHLHVPVKVKKDLADCFSQQGYRLLT